MPGEAIPRSDGTAPHFPAPGSEAIVRLEERNIRADEAPVVGQAERIEETRRTDGPLGRIAGSLISSPTGFGRPPSPHRRGR
ncbi:hypothetical protein OG586_18775 [Streptomyces murinus]|uniref:hypothetical protein n=1 Tax=Streptomyces murinus TaxID=33900 RepID=UPI002E806523|nr:hypothetical protein [Streptomyces murinus]WUD08123.1 hypothetical protein OG586_18775 [Streptomyces murinus]